MKTIFRFLLLFLFIAFYSCNKEEYIDPNLIENQNAFKVSKTAFDTQIEETEEESLENIMLWVSYLTAQALVRNTSAESFFVNTLGDRSQTNIIALESLLNNDNPFREAFITEFRYYTGPICRVPTPSGTPRPGDRPGSGSLEYLYIHMLLNDYDFELYLPSGYNQSLDNVKSSAQVDLIRNSQGFKHFDRCEVEEIVINSNTRDNVIIVKNSENE
ncbi:hypothetical protein [Aquimarina megaterium]|uniref:hypothetical protein n=1 Tax=Aquimarina megaterium TaxID=1443666 RepID=UPI0004721557|nr:hypothetical protein [Aquimarina megaterium]